MSERNESNFTLLLCVLAVCCSSFESCNNVAGKKPTENMFLINCLLFLGFPSLHRHNQHIYTFHLLAIIRRAAAKKQSSSQECLSFGKRSLACCLHSFNFTFANTRHYVGIKLEHIEWQQIHECINKS